MNLDNLGLGFKLSLESITGEVFVDQTGFSFAPKFG